MMMYSYLVADQVIALGSYVDGNHLLENFSKIYRLNSLDVRTSLYCCKKMEDLEIKVARLLDTGND
jgi:hypothetical protein